MAAKRLSPFSGIIVALFAASAAWLTGGALTLTSNQADAPRIGVLPSLVWLGFWLVIGFVLRAALRSKSDRFALLSLSAVLAAPWIPGTMPAAFYIWTGPLRGWLWVVLIAGLAVPVAHRRAPSWAARLARDPRRAPWLAAAVAALAYLGGAYQVFPRLPTGDEPHYLVIAQSVLSDRDLKIENNHRRGDYREYYAGELRPDYLRRGVDGEIYSVHAPGLAVVVAPVLALFGYSGVLVFLALLSAWATALAWIAAWRVTGDVAASWFGWATVALTAPFFFQSFVVYPDAPGAALIMAGVLTLVQARTRNQEPGTPVRLVATGAALAMLPWLHTRYVAAAVMLAIMILAREWTAGAPTRAERVRRTMALLLIPVVSALCWFGFFYVIYGSPDPRGPYGGGTQSSVANLSRGIVGLLFDQQFGVLPAAPVLLCALAGLAVLLRRSPRLAAELLILAAPYGLVVGAYQMWWGGNSSPGRFVIPILLPMAIPAAVWFHTRRGHAAKLLGLGGLTVSLLATVTLAAVDRGILVYNFRDGSSRLLTWLSPLVDITTGLPSVFQTTPAAALVHALVWIAAIALTAAIGVVVERRGTTRTSVAVALGFSAVICASLALTIVWRDHGTAARITPASGAMAFLRQYDPDSGQFAIRDKPLRRVRMRDVLANVTLADTASDGETGEPSVALFRLPAGTYAIEGAGAAGPVTVTIDSELGPQWSWNIGDSTAPWRRELRLPVPLRAMAIAANGARRLAVRPVAIDGSKHQLARIEPAHAARYGPAVVFLTGGNAFMEPGGTWIEGGRSADFVVSPDAGAAVRVLVRNPPVANVITLEGDGWREFLVMAPGEERLVTLPVAGQPGAMRLRVTAAQGVRPTAFEPASTDTRFLGCWIETRP